jgi:hypothetical protein
MRKKHVFSEVFFSLKGERGLFHFIKIIGLDVMLLYDFRVARHLEIEAGRDCDARAFSHSDFLDSLSTGLCG